MKYGEGNDKMLKLFIAHASERETETKVNEPKFTVPAISLGDSLIRTKEWVVSVNILSEM